LLSRDEPTPLAAHRRDDELRRRIELTGFIALGEVEAAVDERVEPDTRLLQRRQLTGGRDEHARLPSCSKRLGIAGAEVDGVGRLELVPWQRVAAVRVELRPDQRDRPLPRVVEERERLPLRLVPNGVVRTKPERDEALERETTRLVVADRGKELAGAGALQEAHRGDRSAARRLDPALARVDDLARRGHALDGREPNPLDVSDHGRPHALSLTLAATRALHTMMEIVLPPFERFYEEHREEVLAYLRRLLPREAAEDAWQETFLRALRAYSGLRHGRHLRAWVFTIAHRVAIDDVRRRRPQAPLPEWAAEDSRPAYAELAEMTRALPRKERVAVVLRYGYDLDYDQIGAVLDSSGVAARQAASSGVRRLRKEAR
jgi:RNA polymerase sigma factor (sigma-70 family)